MNKYKILLVCMRMSPFINRDLEILKKNFDVKVIDFDKKTPIYLLKSTINSILGVIWSDVIFSWFANFHSLLPILVSKIFFKKSITVVGGYDVACEPGINYGLMLKPNSFHARIVKIVLKISDIILPFSDFSAKMITNLGFDNYKMLTVSLGCDTDKFVPDGSKENVALTVCVISKENILRKGLITIIDSAKYLPNIKFIIAGPDKDNSLKSLKNISPKNVEFTGYLSEENLIKLYQRAKIYLQLSYQEGEGAGGALGEAMSCECIPIVSSKAIALKETVGDCGFYVPYGNVFATVESIKNALSLPNDFGKKGRMRMISFFSMGIREIKLVNIIGGKTK